MARRKKNEQQAQTKQVKKKVNEAKLLQHIGRLNLRSKEAYKAWCIEHGFDTSFVKTALQRERELNKYKQLLSQQRLRQHSSQSNLRQQILKISKGEVPLIDLRCEILLEVFDGFKKSKKPDLLLETLLLLERRSKLLSDPKYVRGIIALVANQANWKRELNIWRPHNHNVSRQFASLIRYLMADYEVPAFMDSAWYFGKRKQQNWFMHIGNGNNIRTADGLPVKLTKKMAHHYLQAPEHYSVRAAFRWAQVLSLGGDKILCDSIIETQLGSVFKDDEFCLSVLRFFVENPMLDRAHIHPIIDYIWNEKYADQHEYDADGRLHNTGPAQPNFTMRGRSTESLLAQVEAWHRQLGRVNSNSKDSRWQRWTVGDYKFVEGSRNNGTNRLWQIRELLTSKELVSEGRKQKHCVASYAASCLRGESAIYTMDVRDCDGERKLLTVEVDRKRRVVCQVRGKRNRLPTNAEALVVRRWAQANKLTWAG